jgi:CubicO group peptidase (beta-lactamase class C family)
LLHPPARRVRKILRGARASTRLRGAVERKDVPGVVALVTDRRRVLYQGAFGVADVSTGRALTADAVFRIASMTKPITSAAAMQLIEQGRFCLDDPVEKYLPEFANLKVFESFDAATGAYRLRPASRPPTVRHILTHTSGLGYPFTSAILRAAAQRAKALAGPHPSAWPQPKALLNKRVASIGAGRRPNVWTLLSGSNGSYTRRLYSPRRGRCRDQTSVHQSKALHRCNFRRIDPSAVEH